MNRIVQIDRGSTGGDYYQINNGNASEFEVVYGSQDKSANEINVNKSSVTI